MYGSLSLAPTLFLHGICNEEESHLHSHSLTLVIRYFQFHWQSTNVTRKTKTKTKLIKLKTIFEINNSHTIDLGPCIHFIFLT